MDCSACGQTNPERAKFCGECGVPFAVRCASCSAELPPAAKFCLECGTRAAAAPSAPTPPPASADTRKVVTIVFGDLVGSTALHERLDAESVRQFMESYYAAMRGAVEAHGGRVTQVMGDGVKAVFGAPRVAEDDALRAVRAGVAMQDAFRALAEQQRGRVGTTGLRVAVNTGEVVANDATEIIGDPVNVAARLQEQGKDGDVVIGESTHRLVSTLVTLELLGSFALKGRSEAVKAYRVVSLDRPAGAATAPFVGRDEELARLTAVYANAVEKPAAALAVLVGSPGLGKSRLIDEFARRHADAATAVLAHCDAAGGATFAPLAEALRALLGIESGASAETLRATVEAALPADDADRTRVAGGIAALLAGAPPSPEETFFVVRRLLGALAQTKPVVLVIDDLHWAEPLLLDLVEHLIQWGSGVPLLVLIGARPELRDLRSSLVTPGGLVSDVVTLGGLDAGAAMRLAANVIGASDLPAAIAAKVLATSEGNPLFVGELVRMLVQEGAITREGDRWIAGANLAALEMPPTIHALLAARIERLRPEERTLLERAAVVGRHFSRSAVAALLPHAGDVDARLEALRRSELIERDTGWLLGEPVLRFHHVLIRDAAYRRLLKGTRSELHAKLADWIEAQAGDAAEHDETIGWHLEQAHQLLRELGPLDDAGRQLGDRAATRLAAAGRRALARDDLAVAADLLGRAIERLDADDPARADLALDWCEALLAAGDVGPAAAAIDVLGRFTADSERLRAWHTCFVGQHTVLTAPSALHETTGAVAAAADALTTQGDAAGEAKAHYVHALALSRLGKVGACEAALDRALAAARRAGDRRRANTVLAIAPLAALWGPSPVTRASGRCLDVVRVLRITQGAPAVEAVALSCQGVLEALRGRTEAARRMIASARKMVEELGITQRLLEADVSAGLVALLEGDAPAAEQSLRGAYDGLCDLGLGIDAARAAALLARALLAQDRADEAEALSHESEALAGDDLKAAIAWRGVRAEALARRGERAEAIALASKAVELAAATDALLDHADARLALAAAFRAAGRSGDADAEERRAKELWEAKGATLLAERAAHAAAPAAAPVAKAAPHVALASGRRRVRPNFAFEEMRRAEAAVAARDARALEALYRRDVEIVDHQFGITYGQAEIVERVRAIIEDSTESAFAHEPLASLGDSLALCRMRSTASGSTAQGISIGATEVPYLLLIEADEQGSARAIEIFGEEKLGDSIARLYERYAELQPAGPERERAARAAFSLGVPLRGIGDPERIADVLAPDFVGVDHRHLSNWSLQGAAAYVAHLRALREVADDIEFRQLDVVALAPNAQLMRVLHTGTDRAGGGVYERPFLSLFATDAAGRLVRAEWFDADREAEALACFDALAGGATPAPPARRRVRANRASIGFERFDAAFTARDAAAWEAEFDASLAVIAHPTGASYGREGHLRSLQRLAQSRDPVLHVEPIATLGADLALARLRVAASGATTARYDVGAYEREELILNESGAHGRVIASEIFASDHLAEAVVRLYERHAAQQPEGPARARATVVARSVAILSGPIDLDARAAAFAPDLRVVDHRVFSTWSSESAAAHLDKFRLHLELAPDTAVRIDELLGIEPHALAVRIRYLGTSRESGGAFENRLCEVYRFGDDGRISEVECFEAEHEARALARFDALAAEHAAPPAARRRVRSNAATAMQARMEMAVAARDYDALAAQFHASYQELDQPTGSNYGREAAIASMQRLFRSNDPYYEVETVAALGELLALVHRRSGAGSASRGRYDVGAYENEAFQLFEVDERGLACRSEVFGANRLGDAVVRLYERWADLVPEGPARTRAAAVARAALAVMGSIDLDRMAAAFTPDLRSTDHRVLATWSAATGTELVAHFRHHLELAPDFAPRVDDVLVLGPEALIARITYAGTARDSGGAFENRTCVVFLFGVDGRIAQTETFEAEQEAEALACLDALAGPGERAVREHPFANAASRANRRRADAFNTRDWAGVEACIAQDFVFDERRRLSRNVANRAVWLAQTRLLFDLPESRFEVDLVATRGERLALHVHRFEGSVPDGGGPLALDDHLALHEADRDGRIAAIVLFDRDDEDAAWAELEARFAAGEGALHAIPVRWRRDFTEMPKPPDVDTVNALFDPSFVAHDHRLVGWGTLAGGTAFLGSLRALNEMAPDVRLRGDHLRTTARGALEEGAWIGTHDGGAFESPLVAVVEHAADGRALRLDLYDPVHTDRAIARFAEIKAATAPEGRFENAASRAWRAVNAAWRARDLERFEARHAAFQRYRDHRRLFQLDLDRAGFLDFTRPLVTMRAGDASLDLVATRGERLALMHSVMRMEDETVGPSTIESLMMIETDERGEIVAYDRWDLEDGEAACAELDACWHAGEGAARDALLRDFGAALARRDWDAVAACFAPGLVGHDHRLVGWGTVHGPSELVRTLREMVALASDARMRTNHRRACARGAIHDITWLGTRDGGAFEIPFVNVVEQDAAGRIARVDFYDPHHLDRALSRFAEIEAVARGDPPAADPLRVPPNLALRAYDRSIALAEAGDWEALGGHFAPEFVLDDRRSLIRLRGGRDMAIASLRESIGAGACVTRTLLATAGDRLVLQKAIWGARDRAGVFEVESLMVYEVDAAGRPSGIAIFDPEDRAAAHDELFERYVALGADGMPACIVEFKRALDARDLARTRAVLADDFVYHDRRRTGSGRLVGADAYLASPRAWWELSEDARIDMLYSIAVAPHGRVSVNRMAGRNREGGAFESFMVTLLWTRGERLAGAELFEVDQLDAALARLEELRPDPGPVPPTAATRRRD